MYFVICVFMALCALATDILFTEMLPKWFKGVLALLGAGTSGYAIAIGIRKLAETTKWYAEPKLMTTFYICACVVLVCIVVVTVLIKKKKKSAE